MRRTCLSCRCCKIGQPLHAWWDEQYHSGAIRRPAPKRELNDRFAQSIASGTGKELELEHNKRWLEETVPIAQAFLHARYFLEMAVKYGAEFQKPPTVMRSGWAAILYLYGLR